MENSTQINKEENVLGGKNLENLQKKADKLLSQLTEEETFNILLEDYNYIGSTISLSQEQLRMNIKRYLNVGTDLVNNVSSLGDKDKREALVKRGIKVLKFKKDVDNPSKEASAKDYHYTKGFSNDIVSCLVNMGKFAQCETDLFECKNGAEFVEKFFLRNGYESAKNGNTNLNKTYEIKDGIIVKKEKKPKTEGSVSSDKDKDTNQDEENPITNLEIKVNEILKNDYHNKEIQDVIAIVNSIADSIFKDLGITNKQFEAYNNSKASKSNLKVVNQ